MHQRREGILKMQVVTSLLEVPDKGSGNLVAIGSFDGVHLGHQAIINELVREARKRLGQAIVMTFEPHPEEVLRPGKGPKLLTSREEKSRLLADLGVDVHLVLPFTRTFAGLAPEEFVKTALDDGLRAKTVMVGFNFTFGAGGAGDATRLRALGAELGIPVRIFEPVTVGEETVSSSSIRQLLSEGRVDTAAALLGRPYQLQGPVIHGDHRGRQIGFPTANIEVSLDRQIPGRGVYAVRVRMNGEIYPGMANIGSRPTFDGGDSRLEVHLIDFEGDLYGRSLAVEFVAWLRDERAFAGAAELRAQLQADLARTRRVLAPATES